MGLEEGTFEPLTCYFPNPWHKYVLEYNGKRYEIDREKLIELLLSQGAIKPEDKEADDEVEQLQQVLDACEEANLKYLKHIEELEKRYAFMLEHAQQERDLLSNHIFKLEQLCKDLYLVAREGYIGESLHNRLVELGFAEGSEE